ncbi:exodeoxyribonuclease VII large subunit [Stieleria varia]|uniref:Exodeoxyribonuclease 7 large subunit n=1 Tax=Stieleria varia TaxID=2528005 RepID=A0A5C6B042_9BACT|nr:exodeoxyribonuclease VII large subunit [Stieleria varia]TWU05655.1 Exodeoxyribonuclease 7 large subunit [Stieleria varia]
MSDASGRAVSVSELTGHIKAVMEATFPPLWVAGEATDVAKPRSGHIYFTLKDDDAQIRAVIWRGVATRLPFDIENGQAILCYGQLEVYSVRGTYQLVVRKAQPQGIGTLQQAFLKLQNKLNAEGLFDADRKKPLPSHPKRIALVTSPSGAAVHDFLVAAQNRWVDAEILVIPAQVQGNTAAKTIVRAIAAAQRLRPAPDVVVVTRGGGSLEDLWCFNEEPVVRAVAQCTIPTVSAIGHEVDITLCDLAADLRALTPTDAATRVFPDKSSLRRRVDDLGQRLHRSIRQSIAQRQMQLHALSSRPIIRKPLEIIHLRSRHLDELDQRALRAMTSCMQRSEAKLATVAASLSGLSPLDTLSRGYSVTVDEQGRAITDAQVVQSGDVITTRLHQGSVRSRVLD